MIFEKRLSNSATRIRFIALEPVKFLFGGILANGQTIRWSTQKPVLARIFRAIPKANIGVDVGCGGGTYTTELVAGNANLTVALDLSYKHAWMTRERARRKGLRNFHVVVASAEQLPLKDNVADLILCSEVLEHVPDDRAAARELGRISKDGARLVCTVPHPPEPFPNPDHVREGYTEDDVKAMLSSSGFLVDTSQYCMFSLTRLVMRCCHTLSLPLPLLFLCQLEHWLSYRIAFSSPYDLVVSGKLSRDSPSPAEHAR